jgi:hypothetical protein
MQALCSTSMSCWDSVVEAVEVVHNAADAGVAGPPWKEQTAADRMMRRAMLGVLNS